LTRRETALNAFKGAMTLVTPTDAERQKQPMTRWQILQQTQAKMLEIARTADKAKLSDAAFKKWDGYVRQA
jgi:hypothetical protein